MNNKYYLLKVKKKFFINKFTSKDFSELLRLEGITVGKGTHFFGIENIIIDTQRPELLEIGEYCKITAGVKIITHDYSRSVLRMKYGEIIGEARKTKIKNNVFIGIDSIILPGTEIGNNVIIGAGSVVSGKIPDNVVVAGNPAKIIRTLDEHYKKRKEKYIHEAKEYARILISNGIRPTISNMGAFFPIYLPRDKELIKKHNINIKLSGDDENNILECFFNSKPIYNSFEEFIKDL